MKKVLVTGGSGFIGSWVIEDLLRQGIEVLVLDHVAPGIYSKVDRSFSQISVEHFLGDVTDDTAVMEAAAHVDGIIHLAAVLGTQETIQNPRPSAITNIIGGLNIFEAANRYDLPVVYAGVGNHWMREHGAGSYTISKTATEDYSKMFNAFRGGKITVVRPVNAYGPRQSIAAPYGSSKVRKIIPSFVCRALLGDPIEIYGDGTQVSDCVFVGDVSRVFVGALIHTESNGARGTAIEVGPSKSVTVNEIARLVRKFSATHTPTRSEIIHLPMRPGEVENAVVSAKYQTLSRLGPQFEERTFIPLEEGIAETVEWYAKNWLPGYVDQMMADSDV